MSFTFQENLTLYVPQVEEQIKNIAESAATKTNKLVVELAAIHEGMTSNFNNYPAAELEASLSTWVQPYAKPIILNHDPESDSVGRVMAARMDKESDGTPYIRLQVGVTSGDAIEKCLDERFLTGSVGGKAESATCSICGFDWAKASESSGTSCSHQRGKVYKGKLAYFNLSGLTWKEYSFVNIPADQKSSFRAVKLNAGGEGEEADSGWVRAVSFYSVDMNKESIVSLSESEAPTEVLSSMKKKEASATYLNIKGTFLAVSALDLSENDEEKSLIVESNDTIKNEQGETMPITQNSNEENDMSQATETVETEEEDILTVSTSLSADLGAIATETVSEEEETETAEEAETEEEETQTGEEVETTEEVTEPEVKPEEEEQLADKPAEAAVESAENTEATTQEEDTEEIVSLKNELEDLKTENAKLKKHMHYMLAERVVDAKIAVGVLESVNRGVALEEHSKRTASSLADALRDLSGYSSIVTTKNTEMPTMVETAAATGKNDRHSEVVTESVQTEQVLPPVKKLENILVDAMMNRRKL